MTGGHKRKLPLSSERGSRQPLDEVAIAADALFIDGEQVARRAKTIPMLSCFVV
jgi:hypothetical protein